MVRHHIKSSKTQKTNKANRQKAQEEERQKNEKDLNRFAGSSDEEEDDDEEDNNSFNGEEEELKQQNPPKPIDSDDNDTESSDEDEYDGPTTTSNPKTFITTTPGPAGMAGAMNRILGLTQSTKKKPHSSSVVLSKTTTPLQRLRTKEQRETLALRAKRREKRAVNLTAMHKPLGGGGEGMGTEVAMERIHRKVATRGVVALFNAISEHQRERTRRAAEAGILGSSSKQNKDNPEDVRAMTKHGFLDMLQKKGNTTNDSGEYVASTDGNNERRPNTTEKAGKEAKKKSSGWNALKDDFMMNSKMKDWDKQMSGEESFDESDSSGGEDEQEIARKKGGGGTRDLDDVMEGEVSSSSDEE